MSIHRIDKYLNYYLLSILSYLFQREGSESATRTRYDQIKSVKPSSGLILLRTQGKQFYMLDPARFENGTEADFWRLMREVCPKAVPRSKQIS